jgi:hypothetical protein
MNGSYQGRVQPRPDQISYFLKVEDVLSDAGIRKQ